MISGFSLMNGRVTDKSSQQLSQRNKQKVNSSKWILIAVNPFQRVNSKRHMTLFNKTQFL